MVPFAIAVTLAAATPAIPRTGVAVATRPRTTAAAGSTPAAVVACGSVPCGLFSRVSAACRLAARAGPAAEVDPDLAIGRLSRPACRASAAARPSGPAGGAIGKLADSVASAGATAEMASTLGTGAPGAAASRVDVPAAAEFAPASSALTARLSSIVARGGVLPEPVVGLVTGVPTATAVDVAAERPAAGVAVSVVVPAPAVPVPTPALEPASADADAVPASALPAAVPAAASWAERSACPNPSPVADGGGAVTALTAIGSPDAAIAWATGNVHSPAPGLPRNLHAPTSNVRAKPKAAANRQPKLATRQKRPHGSGQPA